MLNRVGMQARADQIERLLRHETFALIKDAPCLLLLFLSLVAKIIQMRINFRSTILRCSQRNFSR